MGLPNTHAIPPRPLSGRIRGVHAPYVRISVSPDLVLRRRRHILRRRAQVRKQLANTNPDDIIEISSGSEADEPPAPPSVLLASVPSTSISSSEQTARMPTQPTSQATTICTRPPRAQVSRHIDSVRPRDRVNVPPKSTHHSKSYRKHVRQNTRHDGNTLRTGLSMNQQPWFRVCLSQLRKLFPELRCEVTETHIVCLLCDPAQPFAAGPGDTLDAFSRHLQLVHFGPFKDQAKQTENHSALHTNHSNSAKGNPMLKGSIDVVAEFLVESGLSANLAGILRAVGVTDRVRMRMLGALPDAELARLDEQLEKQGMDLVAQMLVREGLRRCARAGIQ
ncbi:hypothetical protein GY45DRAFT_248498 [Cubamyces sp. BRFM 1775]|nr:hypothetical protein GY45DRAFT_248498 [Cubamyces sp. BRFM 1775]